MKTPSILVSVSLWVLIFWGEFLEWGFRNERTDNSWPQIRWETSLSTFCVVLGIEEECSSMIECLLPVSKALSSIPSMAKVNK
jgi:hypothetical protein